MYCWTCHVSGGWPKWGGLRRRQGFVTVCTLCDLTKCRCFLAHTLRNVRQAAEMKVGLFSFLGSLSIGWKRILMRENHWWSRFFEAVPAQLFWQDQDFQMKSSDTKWVTCRLMQNVCCSLWKQNKTDNILHPKAETECRVVFGHQGSAELLTLELEKCRQIETEVCLCGMCFSKDEEEVIAVYRGSRLAQRQK